MRDMTVAGNRSFGRGVALWVVLAFAVFLSRVAFWPWPQMKLMAAVVFFIAAKWGRKMGVSSSVAGMLASSFAFGWGSWVLGQCVGIALVAFVGSRVKLSESPVRAAFWAFVAVLCVYGPINDALSSWMYGMGWGAVFAAIWSGFVFNLTFAGVTFACVLVIWAGYARFSKGSRNGE